MSEVRSDRKCKVGEEPALLIGGKRDGAMMLVSAGNPPEVLRVNVWPDVPVHIDYESGGELHAKDADYQNYRLFTLHDAGRSYALYRHEDLPEKFVIPRLLQGYKP